MTQKLRSSTQVWQPRQEYSRFTETEKAKFQTPSIKMMIETLSGTILSRNFHLTLCTQQNQILPLFLIPYFSERREEIAEDVPAPAEDVPAPAPTLETVEE